VDSESILIPGISTEESKIAAVITSQRIMITIIVIP
jgi:hypothetical protein